MKHKFLIPVIIAAVAALLLPACTREHQCRCSHSEDGGHMMFFTVDRSLKCEDITEMSIERHIIDSTNGTPTLERIEVHQLSCHEYAEE